MKIVNNALRQFRENKNGLVLELLFGATVLALVFAGLVISELPRTTF